MNKQEIEKKIENNRILIDKFLSTDIPVKTMAACIKQLSKNNEVLILKLNRQTNE